MPAARRLSALVTARAPVDGALRARWQANIGQARECCGHLLEEAGLEEIERLAGRFTAGRALLFAERIRAGRVVDGYGDLLADDIFCTDDVFRGPGPGIAAPPLCGVPGLRPGQGGLLAGTRR